MGIIHRDLKPGNVKVTDDGKVKVLDFGLAKATDTAASTMETGDADSPTITDHFTKPGTILGTAAYMSPEQARGKHVDKWSDIWAFGCILYECLFPGGPATPVSELDASRNHGTHRWPSFLPDGRHFLFFASQGTGIEPGEIWVGELGSKRTHYLAEASSFAVWSPPGHLLFVRGQELMAQPFDRKYFNFAGDTRPVGLTLIGHPDRSGFRWLAVSTNGVLAFTSNMSEKTQLTWVDRSGQILGLTGEPDPSMNRMLKSLPMGNGWRLAQISRAKWKSMWLPLPLRQSRHTRYQQTEADGQLGVAMVRNSTLLTPKDK